MPTHPTGRSRQWPTDTLTALRLGQRLVTEVPASGPGRRAFVDITPLTTAVDAEARGQGWKRADYGRGFAHHWEYDADRLDGFDYDIGAVLIRTAAAAGEPELTAILEEWHLHSQQFRYPWRTDDPR
ncbi:hypothetical protein [Nocardia gipuzkoensis]|uniref:hypothetical protein n=1 Tax=Nocardia gipuzkoensis TaxID=2749991 RepID=UPI003EE024C3